MKIKWNFQKITPKRFQSYQLTATVCLTNERRSIISSCHIKTLNNYTLKKNYMVKISIHQKISVVDAFMNANQGKYPTNQQKQEIANQLLISISEVNQLFYHWRKLRRDLELKNEIVEVDTDQSQIFHSKSNEIAQSIPTNINSIQENEKSINFYSNFHSNLSSSEIEDLNHKLLKNARELVRDWMIQHNYDSSQLTPKNFQKLLSKSGLTSIQLRKVILNMKMKRIPVSQESKTIIINHLKEKIKYSENSLTLNQDSKTNNSPINKYNSKLFSEDEKKELIKITGLSRLQIREIIRSYLLSIHPITKEKINIIINAYKEWNKDLPVSQLINSMISLTNLSKRQVSRILNRFILLENNFKINKLLKEELSQYSNKNEYLSKLDSLSIANKLNIDEKKVWRLVYKYTFFPLTQDKKSNIINFFKQLKGTITKNDIIQLSKEHSLSIKQIKYLYRQYIQNSYPNSINENIHPFELKANFINGKSIISKWWASNQRSPSLEEFRELTSLTHLSSKQVSDILYNLKNLKQNVTEESKAKVNVYLKITNGILKENDIQFLYNETNLSRKQIHYLIRKFNDPPGKITNENKDFIKNHYKTKEDLLLCQKETGLSKKQILYIIRKFKHKNS